MGRLQQARWTAHAETPERQFSTEIEEGVEDKIKGGVHTYGLTHCLHIPTLFEVCIRFLASY